jgi:hypothetical protein
VAIQNKTVTFLGASAKLTSFTVFLQQDGSYIVTAYGTADDGAGFTEQISTSKPFGSGVAVLSNMAAAALQALRIANGLEV